MYNWHQLPRQEILHSLTQSDGNQIDDRCINCHASDRLFPKILSYLKLQSTYGFLRHNHFAIICYFETFCKSIFCFHYRMHRANIATKPNQCQRISAIVFANLAFQHSLTIPCFASPLSISCQTLDRKYRLTDGPYELCQINKQILVL